MASSAPTTRTTQRRRRVDLPLGGSGGHILGEAGSRPGIEGTAYDTSWVAGVPSRDERRLSRFPSSLEWLRTHQHADGSWGGEIRYEHDRVLSTLAALAPLSKFGRRASDRVAVEAGTRYLWQRGHLLAGELMELVGFELLLPSLVARAKAAGVAVPPHLDIYGAKRAQKLSLIPPAALYSSRTTAVHSLEFLGADVDVASLHLAQGANGAIGNSPAATAFYLGLADDEAAATYIAECLLRGDGAVVPVLHPCDTFELLWSAYHLFLGGVPVTELLDETERQGLLDALQKGGVSLSPSFAIPDADDTAVALLLLHELGLTSDPAVLEPFATSSGFFASFPHERHASVGVNLHVLHTLLRVPGYPNRPQTIERLLSYLAAEHSGLYWMDKWHISPYYATSHALCVLAELPPSLAIGLQGAVDASRDWVRQTQNADGSWGFYGRGTAEETAYAILALTSMADEDDADRCLRGIRYLEAQLSRVSGEGDSLYPPLWIDKCLYTPTLVVQSVVQAAFLAARRAGVNVQHLREEAIHD